MRTAPEAAYEDVNNVGRVTAAKRYLVCGPDFGVHERARQTQQGANREGYVPSLIPHRSMISFQLLVCVLLLFWAHSCVFVFRLDIKIAPSYLSRYEVLEMKDIILPGKNRV